MRTSSILIPSLISVLPSFVYAQPIQVQLAMNYQHQNVSHYLVSEKYDGVRAYWDGQQLWTRHGRLIRAPKAFTANFPSQPLDGELWIDYHHFSDIEGLLEQQHTTKAQWQAVHYMVFDLPSIKAPFSSRYRRLEKLLTTTDGPIHLVKQEQVDDQTALKAKLTQVVQHGGEGLVLHRKSSLYLPGRSGHLLKYKPYEDAEATVIGYRPGQGKYQGMVGALTVRTHDGKTFAVGSGLDDELRAHPPKIGSQITFRYNGLTKYDKPRFPRFLRIYHAL
ncbi:DNA ligase [Celerinatantimonas yamalensis]|uniref:DNA ligase n=1 Tax=Celerinatantimonas yamalensis TaxID=559956 RepID=A0ABW9GAQ6_9GAMM